MKKYKILNSDYFNSNEQAENTFNSLAIDGWVLKFVHSGDAGNRTVIIYIFEKEKESATRKLLNP